MVAPQSLLSQLVRVVRRTHDFARDRQELAADTTELRATFFALWRLLREGRSPPCGTGPIFGNGVSAIGLPGHSLQSFARFEFQPIRCIRDRPRDSLFAINALDSDLRQWCFCELRAGKCWLFGPLFVCPTCDSHGFAVSSSTPLRCTFCEYHRLPDEH